MLFGLRGFPESRRGRPTTRWEQTITLGIAERSSDCTHQPQYPDDVVPLFEDLPRGSKRRQGDFLFLLDNSTQLFVECKSIFECVLRKLKEPIDENGKRYGYDYTAKDENILNDPKNAQTCVSIEEARIDAEKLKCLEQSKDMYDLGLLLLEFDRKGREINNRADYRDLEKYLAGNSWRLIGRESGPDTVEVRAKKGFQEHMVFWVKQSKAKWV